MLFSRWICHISCFCLYSLSFRLYCLFIFSLWLSFIIIFKMHILKSIKENILNHMKALWMLLINIFIHKSLLSNLNNIKLNGFDMKLKSHFLIGFLFKFLNKFKTIRKVNKNITFLYIIKWNLFYLY